MKNLKITNEKIKEVAVKLLKDPDWKCHNPISLFVEYFNDDNLQCITAVIVDGERVDEDEGLVVATEYRQRNGWVDRTENEDWINDLYTLVVEAMDDIVNPA